MVCAPRTTARGPVTQDAGGSGAMVLLGLIVVAVVGCAVVAAGWD